MGRRQHQSDKMYITSTEWKHQFGGKKQAVPGGKGAEFRRLPFDCCALSLQPFEHPVCTAAGVCYDLLAIIPYLKQYGTDPASGEKITTKQLTRLHFHKNGDGKYHCPVTFKVFNENSKITAVKTTGNVFSQEAIDTLNIKVGNWRDLLNDEPFKRADLIVLQDPTNLDKHNLTKFHHLKHNLKVLDPELEAQKKRADYTIRSTNAEAAMTMKALYASEEAWKKNHESSGVGDGGGAAAAPSDAEHSAHYSTGEAAASFTSTHMTVRTTNTAASIEDEVVKYRKVKAKGYVQLTTNMGVLNLELRCDRVPKTCDNFIRHCNAGYYDGTVFHRSIKHFMIQGGDPTGTGTGGESAFAGGEPFADEFQPDLTHSGRGILSMANSGPATNKSQFFITYRSCNHLDRKHSVFGSVVGGMEALLKMERVETDGKDRPKEEIKILKAKVFVDPFHDMEVKEQQAREAEAAAKKKADEMAAATVPALAPAAATVPAVGGVGRYLKQPASAPDEDAAVQGDGHEIPAIKLPPAKKAKKKGTGGFGDFGSW